MSSIKVVNAADIPARTSRHSKTTPLREKIAALTPETSLFVLYYNEEVDEGFKASTIAQLTMVALVLLAPELDRLTPGFRPWQRGLGWWAMMVSSIAVTTLCALALMSYTRLGLQFITAEAKPLEDNH